MNAIFYVDHHALHQLFGGHLGETLPFHGRHLEKEKETPEEQVSMEFLEGLNEAHMAAERLRDRNALPLLILQKKRSLKSRKKNLTSLKTLRRDLMLKRFQKCIYSKQSKHNSWPPLKAQSLRRMKLEGNLSGVADQNVFPHRRHHLLDL